MTTYASIADYTGRTQPQAPVLLWECDFTALATASLVGVTDLGGLTVATSILSGTPTEWRTLNGSGIEIDDDGTTDVGAIDIEITDIEADTGYTFADGDVLVVEVQWAAASSAPTVNGTEINIGFRPDSGNHNTQTGLYKDATGNAIHYMYDGGNQFALHTTVASARSTSIWLMPGRGLLNGIVSASALPDDVPRAAPTYGLQASASKTVTAVGPWALTSANKIRLQVAKGGGETVPVYVEQMRIFVLPSQPYTP